MTQPHYQISLNKCGQHRHTPDLPREELIDGLIWKLARAYGCRHDDNFNDALMRLNDFCGNLRHPPKVSTEQSAPPPSLGDPIIRPIT